MVRNLLLFLFLITPVLACSQNIVSGTVTDSAHTPISRLTISCSKINSTVLIGFTQTNQAGQFRLQINVPQDSILLHLTHLSYEDKQVRLKNVTDSYNFIMAPKIRALSAVNVSAPPIYKRNDTINYSIEPFALKQDRVISDVIKKLPGVEMDGDKILYQGKPIQKYYINGLDLLENRYAIANNNLPIEAVKKIQIIENNQPVKILDSIIFSDRASINIQLKKVTTTGTGKVGLGLSPALWDVNLTPMTFNRNFQAINSFQTNNIGDNVSRQLDALTQNDLYEVMELSDLPVKKTLSLFTVQEPSSPFFNEKRWLVNRTFLLNSNTLQKLKNDYELKINVSYVNDNQQRTGSTYTTFYTPNENINILEKINNRYNTNKLRGNIIFSKNEKNIYLKNNFQFSKSWIGTTGSLLRNDYDPITQNLGVQDFDLSNRFTTLKFIGSRLFTFNSLISVSQTPQSISVAPGQFESFLNANVPYSELDQQVHIRNFITGNYISFIKPIKQFTIVARIGTLLQNQALQTGLYTNSGGNPSILGSDFRNAIHRNTLSAYAELKTQYKTQRWKVDVNLPLPLRDFTVKDDIRSIQNSLFKFNFEPKGMAIYTISAYLQASISSAYANEFGEIDNLYNGYLLISYRNLQRFNATIPQSKNWRNNLSLNYKNVARSLFANLGYNYNDEHKDYLFSSRIDSSGFNTIELINQNNTRLNQVITGDFSKYIQQIRTLVKISGNANLSSSGYLLNNRFSTNQTQSYTSAFNITNTSLKHLNVSYTFQHSVIVNGLTGSSKDKFFMNSQQAEASIFPGENHIVVLNAEYYSTSLNTQNGQTFVDLRYNLKIPKKKIDLEMSVLNILNNRTYTQIYNSGFSIIKNNYVVRPRQFTITYRFKF